MECIRLEKKLIDIALGATPTADQRSHLVDCPACRAQLERCCRATAQVDHLLSETLLVEPSAHLIPRVRARLAGKPVQCVSGLWIPALTMAIVLLIASVALLYLRRPVTTALPTPASVSESVVGTRAESIPHTKPLEPQNPPRKPNILSARVRPESDAAPEILVTPGQLKAVARFAWSLNRQMKKPAYILPEQLGWDNPIQEQLMVDVRPILISPLQVAAASPSEIALKEPRSL